MLQHGEKQLEKTVTCQGGVAMEKSHMITHCNRQNSFRPRKEVLIPMYKSLIRAHPEQESMAAKFKEEQAKTRANKMIKRTEILFCGLEEHDV